MRKDFIHHQQGVGLIEVLVTTVVIAIGLLAVASLQGTFISSSASNKTRSEALVLAEQKIEELRNTVSRTGTYGYDNINSAPLTGTYLGTTETFRWTKTFQDLTNPSRRRLSVDVCWPGSGLSNCTTAANDKRVTLTSEIGFSNPGNSAGIAEFGKSSGKSPSPNQSASKSIDSTVDLFDDAGNLLGGVTNVSGNLYSKDGKLYRHDGTSSKKGTLVFYCNQIPGTVIEFDPDLRNPLNYETTGVNVGQLKTSGLINLLASRGNLDGKTGNEAITLYTKNYNSSGNADGSCTPVHQFDGGAIVTIKGNVRTINNLDHIKIDFNKIDMYCVYNAGTGETIRPYACYAGAGCQFGPAGDNNNLNTCPNPTAANDLVGPGGFSGNVGLLNVDDDGSNKESVCFQDELIKEPIETPATARKYKTLNSSAEQGINRSYACQDFQIVDRQANFDRLSARCAAVVGSVNIPPKVVIREISGSNVLASQNTSYCSARAARNYSATVTLPTISGNTYTVTTSTGTCSPSPATSSVTCTGSTYGVSIEIFAVSNTGRVGSCIIDNLETGSNTKSCSITLSLPPTYTIQGQLTVSNGSGVYKIHAYDSFQDILCTPNPGPTSAQVTTYSCTISSADLIVTLKTIKESGGKTIVVDNCSQTLTAGVTSYTNGCALKSK